MKGIVRYGSSFFAAVFYGILKQMENNSSKFGLIKKAFEIWVKQYHCVIPKEILKTYIHKFMHERSNIRKYGQRFFDPSHAEEYQKWLSFLPAKEPVQAEKSITYLSVTDAYCADKVQTEYVCLVGKGVQLAEDFAERIPVCNADLIYTDHDEFIDGNVQNPVCKPDFSYYVLQGFNYIGSTVIVKKKRLETYDRQVIDVYKLLKEMADANASFFHVSEILYHETIRIKEEISLHQPAFKETPLVSILIPTKDGVEDLRRCIDSIYQKSTYQNFELIIMDNNSEKKETFAFFKEQKQKHSNFFVHRIECPFNFSLINNFGAKHAHGEYLVLLNNDTEVITADWLEQMLSFAQEERVGSVGVKLYYEDGTIQHGGVIAGKGGGFAHRYYRKPHDETGYLHTMDIPNEVFCCTAACLMIPKNKYDEVGGMNEELTVQFNDVDLGIRLLEHGYVNLFLPRVELFHYESKSRGIDKDPKAVKRFFDEVHYAEQHYAKYMEHDPYYNDAFDKNYDYMLKAGTGSN